MRPVTFSTSPLRQFLRRNRIATLPELKQVLGTTADITVFRKLKELSYHASYSHRGSFYTLDEIADFDDHGLWSFNSVWFSRHGTLVDTAEAFVNQAPAGYFAAERDGLLHLPVKEPLLRLVRQGRIVRQEVSGLYLYCACDRQQRKQQSLARQARLQQPSVAASVVTPEPVSDELQAAIVLFWSLLDERQRRLYAGLESLKLGHGGDHQIAEFLDLDPHTVAKGRRPTTGSGCGGGPSAESGWRAQANGKKTPEVIAVIQKLLERETAGDACVRSGSSHGAEVDQKNDGEDRCPT